MAISTSGVSVPQLGSIGGVDSSIYQNAQPPKGMTLGELVNLSRSNIALQKEKALLEPEISGAKAESERLQTQAKKAGIDLNQHTANIARGVYGGYLTDPDFINGNKDEMIKKLKSAKDFLTSQGLTPPDQGKGHDDLLTIAQKDPKAAYQAIKTGVMQANGPQAQLAQTTPQYTTNATGQIVGLTSGTNQISEPTEAGGQPQGAIQNAPQNGAPGQMQGQFTQRQSLNPTTPGVQNFGEYQKDLTNRVAGGTQIDMRLNEAEDLMKKFKAGAGARTYVDIAQKLQAVGAPQDLVDKVAKGDLSAAQSLNKFIAQSVTAGIGAMQGNPTANMMNDYLKNNPDIASDPRALQRFIDFAHKQNELAYEEQRYLLDKSKNGTLNPDTHVGEVQQHILQKFVKPEGGKEKTISSQENKQIVRTGKTKSGQRVVEYSDGTREIQ